MDRRQEVFLRQARSDHEIFLFLEGRESCHRLHYLQMSTEKLAKAFFWGTKTPPDLQSHSVLSRFLRAIASRSDVRQALGYTRKVVFESALWELQPLAEELEQMAPALANGPNPEYPWPRENPTTAPVDYAFPLWRQLEKTSRGKKFLKLLKQLLGTSQSGDDIHLQYAERRGVQDLFTFRGTARAKRKHGPV